MAHVVNAPSSEDQGPLLNRVSLAVYTVAVIFVVLRFLTRGWVVRKFGLDDCLIAIAVSLGAAQTAAIILQVQHGRGQHADEVSVQHFNKMLMYKWINMLVYYVANWAVKMSILALYHRIGHGQEGLPWVLRTKVVCTVAVAITLFTVAIFLVDLFGCTPVSRAWDVQRMSESCILRPSFNMAQGSINVAIDLLLLMFPLPLLRILKINTKQRSALAIIFSIGLIPLVASIMRLCEIVMASAPKGQSWLDGDTSWRWAWVPVWSQIEVDVSIVAASLPSLSPLLKRVWSGFATERSMTPSQIPTLTEPLESRGLQPLPNHSAGSMGLKEAKRLTFFDDRRESDEELDCERPPSSSSRVELVQTETGQIVEVVKGKREDSGG